MDRLRRSLLATGSAAFWFMMQIGMLIGFATTYTVNWMSCVNDLGQFLGLAGQAAVAAVW